MTFKKCLTSLLSGALLFSPLSTSFYNLKALNPEISDEQSQSAENTSAKRLIQNGFYLEKEYSPEEIVSLDIFLKQNLNVTLKNGLLFILDDKNTSFIDNKQSLNECILQNDLLCDYIKKIVSLIDSKEISESDKQFQILRRLTNMKNFMKVDKSISETNNFFKFISAMQHTYKTVISRKVANDILSENRTKIEKTMGSQSASSDAQLSTSANIDGVILGISAGIQKAESTTETSFYTIDSSANVGVSVGVGLQKYLSLSVEDNIAFTHSLILYSLEQFLDASLKDGKLSSLELREPDIKKIADSRKEMQKKEKKLLSLMQNSIEWYLKASEIVPQNVNLKWPNITEAKSGDKKNTISSTISANAAASCLASAGMNVSKSTQEATIYTHSKFLNLIEKDCSPSVYGESAETISKFLKQNKIKKYKEIKSFVEEYISKHPDLSDDKKNEMISALISNLTGDIKIYNNALSVLADENASKEQKANAKKTKNETEKYWIKTSKISRLGKGRLEILKTAIALAAYLSELSTSENNIPLLEKLYNEIEHLTKMQAFSKNTSKQKAEYSTSRKCYTSDVTGKAYFKIPIIGTNSLCISYTENIGDASFDTNKDITIQTQIPMIGDKALGTHSIRENFKKIIESVSKTKNNPFAPELEKSLSLLDSNFENILKSLGIDIPIGIPDHFNISKYMLLNFYLTRTDKTGEDYVPLPLPESEIPIILSNNEWVLKLIKRIDTASANINIGIDDIGSIALSSKIGKASAKIGNNTLTFIINKFNLLNTGLDDNITTKEMSENIIWQDFKKAQSEELTKLFININEKTNARYELQCIWNAIVKNISKNKEQYQNAYKDFANFLTACKNLSENNSKENFDNTSKLFDKILKLNYDFNYMPELSNLHSIRTQEKLK